MAIEEHELAKSSGKPALPTYHTIADVLEKRTGSGLKLLGWTAARSILIAPFMMIVKVPPKQAIAGSLLASCAISIFALVRIYNAEYELEKNYLRNRKWLRKKNGSLKAPRALTRQR